MTDDPSPPEALVVQRVINAPVRVVYRVWTEREFARRWNWGARFDTLDVSIDCRVGGRWTQTVRDRDTKEVWSFVGEFQIVEPLRHKRDPKCVDATEADAPSTSAHQEAQSPHVRLSRQRESLVRTHSPAASRPNQSSRITDSAPQRSSVANAPSGRRTGAIRFRSSRPVIA
ncbi:MAG TPA: SRPBCC domain-containing protein [Gemmatimonadaceae bacterium]